MVTDAEIAVLRLRIERLEDQAREWRPVPQVVCMGPMTLQQAIIDLLRQAGRPLPAGSIHRAMLATGTGYSITGVHNSITRAMRRGLVVRVKRGWYAIAEELK